MLLNVRLAAGPTRVARSSLALAGSAQLLYKPRLLKLRKHANDLAHGNPHLVMTLGEIIAPRGDHAHAMTVRPHCS
jgi:hypothetical protein